MREDAPMRAHPRLLAASILAMAAVALVPGIAQGVSLESGRFVSTCKFSHESHDDPIVFFRQPGFSHLHHFFGNSSTNARTTPRKLRRKHDTTCSADDRSAYWIPALTMGDRVVKPDILRAYYTTAMKDPRTIQAPPRGLKMIAGDAGALTPQKSGIASWFCYSGQLSVIFPEPFPDCGGDGPLGLSINFPDCWDGVNRDSPDHQSHMAYSQPPGLLRAYARCPATHPVPLPGLHLTFLYPTAGAPSGIELASGGAFSAHADFINGWPQAKLEALVRECLNGAVRCRDRH
jgi:hypothetical protein